MKMLAMVLLALIGSVLGQEDCDAALEAFSDCASAAYDGEDDGGDWKAKKEEGKAAMAACFVDNGCEDPVAAWGEKKECKKGVFTDVLLPAVEECLDFALPASMKDWLVELATKKNKRWGRKKWGKKGRKSSSSSDSDGIDGNSASSIADEEEEEENDEGDNNRRKRWARSGKGNWEEKMKAKLDRKLAKHCGADSEASDAARACLTDLWTAKKAEWEAKKGEWDSEAWKAKKEGWKAKKAAKKAALAECKAALSEECQAELYRRKDALCECGKSLAPSVLPQLQACKGSDNGDEEEEQGPSYRQFRGLYKKLCKKGNKKSSSSSSSSQSKDE